MSGKETKHCQGGKGNYLLDKKVARKKQALGLPFTSKT